MTSTRQTGEPIKSSPEADALTGWRRLLRFRRGERKAAKASFNRRVRRQPVEVEIDEED